MIQSTREAWVTQVVNYMPAPQPIPGRGGLIAFGVISIVIGSLAGCMALAALPMMLLIPRTLPAQQQPPGLSPAAAMFTLVLYAAIATAFIWIGIGSCRCQRWVRPIILCLAWPGLVFGIVGSCVAVPVMVSTMLNSQQGAPPMPPAVRIVMVCVMVCTMVLFYIILPGAYVLFYQRRKTAEVLALCDPYPRWTDRCPMPVLGLCIWLVIMELGMLYTLQVMYFPFFGTYLHGAAAAVAVIALVATIGYAAWKCYQLQWSGWWTAMLTLGLWFLSMLLTFIIRGPLDFYRQAGLTDEQLEQSGALRLGGLMVPMMGFYAVLFIAYLLYIRRYFKAQPHPTPPA